MGASRSRTLLLAVLAASAPAARSAETAMPIQSELMPAPAGLHFDEGRLRVDGNLTAAVAGPDDARLNAAISRTLGLWEARTGLRFPPAAVLPAGPATLTVECRGPGRAVPGLGEDESYALRVQPGGAVLRAETAVGALRGLATLAQLLARDANGWFLPAMSINDAPRFPWRGLMIDAARHWQPPEVIKRNLDGMALVKLNVLHLHLTDDQGFRIESRTHPELQERGSDGLYFTQAQMRDIIGYARARGIRVVPEFDLPGHATSWAVSHPELCSLPGPYAIERHWGIFNPVLDPTNEALYALLDDFFGEMAGLFPDDYVHIGGDENNGEQWNANPGIQAFIRAHGLKGNEGLQAYFNRRVGAILARRGKRLVGWDEILHPDLPKDAVIQSWRGPQSLAEAARLGYSGILSNGYYINLNYPVREHYLNDPLPDGTSLSPEERRRVLGGEATMWTEWATPETIDLCIWPRTAAIAERLWSPREVRDVPDMVRRLAAIDQRLGEAGLLQERNRDAMLRRLAGGNPGPAAYEALRIFMDVVEPVKGYERGRLQPGYVQSTPLDGLADCARPESESAREFAERVDGYLARVRGAGAARPEGILRTLESWNAAGRTVADDLPAASARMAEGAPLARALADASAAGRDAVEALAAGRPPGEAWLQARNAELDRAAQPVAGAELAIVVPVRLLVAAAAEARPRDAQ
jgi:hexosaminidase